MACITPLWLTGLNRGCGKLNYNKFRVHVTSGNFHCFSKAINSRLPQSSTNKYLPLGLCKETVKQSCFIFCSEACSFNTTLFVVTICTMTWLSSNWILFLTGLLLTLLVAEYFSIMTSKSETMMLPSVRSHYDFLSHPLPKLPPRLAHIPPQINPKGWPIYPQQDPVDQNLISSIPITSGLALTAKDLRAPNSFQSRTTSHPGFSTVSTWAMTQPMNSSVTCNTSILPHDGRGYHRRIPQAIVIGAMKGGTGMLCNSLLLY